MNNSDGNNISVIILAAGFGTRMKSGLPKVLHKLAEKPLLKWVIDALEKITLVKSKLIVCGYKGEQVISEINSYYNDNDNNKKNDNIKWIFQKQPLGTGHAVLQAFPELSVENLEEIPCQARDDKTSSCGVTSSSCDVTFSSCDLSSSPSGLTAGSTLILSGDVPLIHPKTIEKLIFEVDENSIGLVTCKVKTPFGLGRIIRDENNNITTIIEEKDADDKTKRLNEINAGIYLFPTNFLQEWLPKLQVNNSQKEYYLTDLISFAFQQNIKVVGVTVDDEMQIMGVNNRYQLSLLERHVQQEKAKSLMIEKGVTILDPSRIDIRTDNLSIGKDVTIDVNVILEGKITIGNNVYIGPNTIIKDSTIEDNAKILSHSVIESAQVGANCNVGPFARLRPNTVLKENAKIGNFVEVKKSIIGENSKVNHLSYVGDSLIGKNVNVGAGTITCNYDGANKHKTIIEDDVFIGSDTQLVAPVIVGKGATIAAGTTLTKDAPANMLTITRKAQKTIERWQRPEAKEAEKTK